MEYLIVGLLLVLIVTGAVMLVMRRARKHGRQGERAAADREYGGDLPGGEVAILAPDDASPLGDTSEHAGRQRDGETVDDQDAARSGGSSRPRKSGGYAGTAGIGEPGRDRPQDDPHIARPVDGGEGEGTRRI